MGMIPESITECDVSNSERREVLISRDWVQRVELWESWEKHTCSGYPFGLFFCIEMGRRYDQAEK
jgi:hypothetical protein